MQTCLLLHAKAMGGDGKGGREGAGKRRGDKPWMEFQRDRLEEWGVPATGKGGKGKTPEERGAAVKERTLQVQRDQPGRTGVFCRPPEDEEDDSVEPVATAMGAGTAHAAALRTHRMVEGRRASGLDSQRNTFDVLGRPVQVFGQSKKVKFSCQ